MLRHILTDAYRVFFPNLIKRQSWFLVDDGSTDASGAKCDEWASKDKRVIVLHKENGGVSSARNEGLDKAKGEYITFVDPDDFIAPDTYAPNMEYLINHPEVDILQYPYCHYFSDGYCQIVWS